MSVKFYLQNGDGQYMSFAGKGYIEYDENQTATNNIVGVPFIEQDSDFKKPITFTGDARAIISDCISKKGILTEVYLVFGDRKLKLDMATWENHMQAETLTISTSK